MVNVRKPDGSVVKRVLGILDPCDVPLAAITTFCGVALDRQVYTFDENKFAAELLVNDAVARWKAERAKAKADDAEGELTEASA